MFRFLLIEIWFLVFQNNDAKRGDMRPLRNTPVELALLKAVDEEGEKRV